MNRRMKYDLNKKILRGSYINEYRIEYFKEQNYITLKKECHKNGILFNDPLFPANNQSLFYTKSVPARVKWLRYTIFSVVCLTNYFFKEIKKLHIDQVR